VIPDWLEWSLPPPPAATATLGARTREADHSPYEPGNTVNQSYFASETIIFIGTNEYSDDLCAVAIDGSLWCIGTNQHGQLGVGNTNPVNTETTVQPGGSAYTACQRLDRRE
jgi:hypothetical protein